MAVVLADLERQEQYDQDLMEEMGILREWGRFPLLDGTELAYVIYRPKGDVRLPVMLEFAPYSNDGTPFHNSRVTVSPKTYLDRGYAYAGIVMRGCSGSTGEFDLDTIPEDGKQAVEWLADQPWADGVIMAGVSFAACTALSVSPTRPRGLVAIVAAAPASDSYMDVEYAGGIFNVSFASGWAFNDVRIEHSIRRATVWRDNRVDLDRASVARSSSFYRKRDNPLYGPDWLPQAPRHNVPGIQVPTLFIQGFQDEALSSAGTFLMWHGITDAPKHMLAMTGGHLVFHYRPAQDHMFSFLDHYVKGADNGFGSEGPVRVLWDTLCHSDDLSMTVGWETHYEAIPPAAVEYRELYLAEGQRLVSDKAALAPDAKPSRYVFPKSTEVASTNRVFAVEPDPAGIVRFRTEPMKDDLAIFGCVQLALHLSAEMPDTDIMVALHDIDPDGNTTFVQRDFLRASMRSINREACAPEILVRHYDRPEPLVPGEIYELEFSFPPIAHVLREGHALELMVMTPPVAPPCESFEWGFSIVNMPGRNSVHHSPSRPSRLTLPVLPGQKAECPPLPFGAGGEDMHDRRPSRAKAAWSY